MNPHQDGYGHRALRLSCIVFFSTQLIGLGATQQIGIHEFTLPDGFVIEQVAGSPLVDRPIVADYDDQGRLYVADSSGSNDKVQQQLEDKPHRIVRLEDTDGDGVFDQSVVFAEGLMFPEGVLTMMAPSIVERLLRSGSWRIPTGMESVIGAKSGLMRRH